MGPYNSTAWNKHSYFPHLPKVGSSPSKPEPLALQAPQRKGGNPAKVCHDSLQEKRMESFLHSIHMPHHPKPTCLNQSSNYLHPAPVLRL